MDMFDALTINEHAQETIVCLHGFGSTPQNMAAAVTQLGEYRYVLPRGPHKYVGGYGWYNILKSDEQHREASIASLVDFITDLKRQQGFDRCFLLGFSQGAELAYKIAVERPELVRAAVGIVGWLAHPEALRVSPASKSVSILAINGSRDLVLPPTFCKGSCIEKTLHAVDVQCELKIFPMGHEMSDECAAYIKQWLGRHTR